MTARQVASKPRSRVRGFDHRTRRLLIGAALGLLALAPVAAAGAELVTFELPSTLVDPSTPGGTLEDGRTVPKVHVLLPDGYRADSKRGYRFAAPPSTVARFERAGAVLTATGSGTVEITGRRACRFSAELPFERRQPRACGRSSWPGR